MRLLEQAHLSRQERGVDSVRITLTVEKGWGVFWEGGVDSERLAYRCLKGPHMDV